MHVAVTPAGTLRDAIVDAELVRIPLCEEWGVERRMCLTRDYLYLAEERSEVSFALSLEIFPWPQTPF